MRPPRSGSSSALSCCKYDGVLQHIAAVIVDELLVSVASMTNRDPLHGTDSWVAASGPPAAATPQALRRWVVVAPPKTVCVCDMKPLASALRWKVERSRSQQTIACIARHEPDAHAQDLLMPPEEKVQDLDLHRLAREKSLPQLHANGTLRRGRAQPACDLERASCMRAIAVPRCSHCGFTRLAHELCAGGSQSTRLLLQDLSRVALFLFTRCLRLRGRRLLCPGVAGTSTTRLSDSGYWFSAAGSKGDRVIATAPS